MRKILVILLLFSFGFCFSDMFFSQRIGQNKIENPVEDDVLILKEINGVLYWKNFPQDSLSSSGFPLDNGEWATWLDNAGTDTLNVIRVNSSDEAELGVDLNAGLLEYADNPDQFTAWGFTVDELTNDIHIAWSRPGWNNVIGIGVQADNAGGTQGAGVWLDGAEVTTTDTVHTTIDEFIIPDDTIYRIKATIVGMEQDSTSIGCEYERVGLFHNSGGAGATMIGETSVTAIESYANDTNFDFYLSGDSVLYKVRGIASETWTWIIHLEYEYRE